MYAVSWFKPHEREGDIFPNVFPDLDMAIDCVIYEIKVQFADELSELAFDVDMGGKKVVYYEDTIYVIRKLFNFNPKGL